MFYDVVAAVSQVTSLLLFLGLFVGVLAFVLWPGSGERLERAQRRALGLRPDRKTSEDC